MRGVSHEKYGTILNIQDCAQNGHQLNSAWQQTHSTNILIYITMKLRMVLSLNGPLKPDRSQGHLRSRSFGVLKSNKPKIGILPPTAF